MVKIKMSHQMKNQNRRGLPAELLNELFASMPLQHAICLLVKMLNGLLARNVHKMIYKIKEALDGNKLNDACGSKLSMCEERLIAKYSINSIRSVMPVPKFYSIRALLPVPILHLVANKPIISFYFEIEILNKSFWDYGIFIGFCEQKFSLEITALGGTKNSNSIGIYCKRGIWINGSDSEFEKDGELWKKWNFAGCKGIEFGNDIGMFKKGDFAGIGLIRHSNSKMECFSTVNGQFMGKMELPSKLASIELFPAISLISSNHDSIRAHFKRSKWQFKNFKCVLE